MAKGARPVRDEQWENTPITKPRKPKAAKKPDGRVGKRKAGKFRTDEIRRDQQYAIRVMSAPTDLQGLISHYGAAHLIALVHTIIAAQPGDLISDGRGCYTKKY